MPQPQAKATALTGEKKAAMLLISLGQRLAAEVYKRLSEGQVEQVTLQIANIKKITVQERDQVLEEAYEIAKNKDILPQGGLDYARDILEHALGNHKAMDILNRLQGSLRVTPFDFIRHADAQQIINFIQNEHPQTIALIIAHLSPDQAAMILAALPNDVQVEVTKRIAMMDRATPDVIMEVERILERKMSSVFTQEITQAGGVRAVAEILNRTDRGTEKGIMEKLDEENPQLADEVKRLMFVFEDIILLDDRTIQQVLREIDTKDLAVALKGSSEEVKMKILKNMSSRAKAMILEDMEVMGPVRLKHTEEAQQKVVNVIRQLEEAGEIIIARGGEEEVFV